MFTGYHHSGVKASASVQALAARNLQFLQAIETTVDHLLSDVELLSAISRGFAEIHRGLEQSSNGTLMDPSGNACLSLEQASDACVRMHRRATEKHGHACNDRQLRADDGVTDAYRNYIAAVSDVHDQIEAVREWIATHDALLQPPSSGVFQSVDDMFTAMGVKAV